MLVANTNVSIRQCQNQVERRTTMTV